MNAAERFFEASRAGDFESAVAELADEVVLLNPGSDDPIVGREAVAATLSAVEAACDEFEHTHLLVEQAPGQALVALVFDARVGDQRVQGVDLLELDGDDRIGRFTVAARPVGALMALAARMTAQG